MGEGGGGGVNFDSIEDRSVCRVSPLNFSYLQASEIQWNDPTSGPDPDNRCGSFKSNQSYPVAMPPAFKC